MIVNPFTTTLLRWYEQHGRSLPWRATHDPYAIWLSEIILQQTRIEQGLPYWERFMQRFPTVDALAEASEDEVLRLWQGLGYYSRARNLHKAARQVVAQGGFPQTYEGLRALKGVGDYTAAAIGAFAFGLPVAAVDQADRDHDRAAKDARGKIRAERELVLRIGDLEVPHRKTSDRREHLGRYEVDRKAARRIQSENTRHHEQEQRRLQGIDETRRRIPGIGPHHDPFIRILFSEQSCIKRTGFFYYPDAWKKTRETVQLQGRN